MINVDQITSRLAKLPDQALQQYAAMHKNDPYIMSLAVAESNRRKEMRQAAQGAQGGMEPPKVADQALAEMAPQGMASQTLPEDVGIGQLPAGDMNFADGGIVAFARGGSSRQAGAAAFEAALDAEGVRDPAERAFLKALHAQESRGQKTSPTSNRGARGPMQILPKTFKSVADEGMQIDDPMDNMRAGIRYGLEGYRAAKGDPVLAGAYYYGGPNALQKARQGIALRDPQNPDFPTTIQYGNSIAKRMTAMLPIATATAADQPSPTPVGLTREQAVAQIPGQTGQPVPPQPTYTPPAKKLTDYIYSPFQTMYSLAHNTAALPIAGVEALARNIAGDKEATPDISKYAYVPTNPVAQEQLETIGRVMTDLKIPAYIPGLTPVRGAAQARPADFEALRKAELTRLPPPTPAMPARLPPPTPRVAGASPESQGILQIHPDRLAALEARRLAMQQADQGTASADAAAANAARLAAQADDAAAAAAARGRLGDVNTNIAGARTINEALPGQAARTGLAGAVGQAAQAEESAARTPEAVDDGSYGRLEQARLRERSFAGAEAPKIDAVDKQDIVDAAKQAMPGKKGRGLTGEDWLMLGLGMMSSKSPRFLSALGEAGLGAMKARQERFKAEREEESDIALSKYREAMAAQAAAQTDVLKSGNTKTKLALEAANTMYDNWLNTMKANPLNAMGIDPAVANAKYNQLLQQSFSSFNIPVPTGLLTGTGTPAQYTDADRALVERYAQSR